MALLTPVHISIVLLMSAFKSEGRRFDIELSRENLSNLFCRCSVHGTTEQNREGTRPLWSLSREGRQSPPQYTATTAASTASLSAASIFRAGNCRYGSVFRCFKKEKNIRNDPKMSDLGDCYFQNREGQKVEATATSLLPPRSVILRCFG